MKDAHALLVIEDDKTFRMMLRAKLEDDFVILEASNKTRTINILENHVINIILLDLYLEDGYSFNLIEKIRQLSNALIIVLSGEDDNDIKIDSFKKGADDYITKPCDMDFLSAKIKAYIGRMEKHDNPLSEKQNAGRDIISFEKWTLDKSKFQAFDQNNRSAELTPCEFTLLNYLIENTDRAVTREELCSSVKDDNYIPSNRALDVKITRLRKKIETKPDNPSIIQTIRGIGYIFNKDTIKSK